jgi:hypothetical protein
LYAINDAVAAAWRRLFDWIARAADVPLDVAGMRRRFRSPIFGCDRISLRADVRLSMGELVHIDRTPDAARRADSFAAGFPRSADLLDRHHRARRKRPPIGGRSRSVAICVHRRRFAERLSAPRHFFAAPRGCTAAVVRGDCRAAVYATTVVEAVIANEADAGPLDAWWHALLRRHEPTLAAQLRTVAATRPTPIPFVVCSAGVENEVRQRLVAAFERVEGVPELADVRDSLLLARFARPKTTDYESLTERARAADALGYHRLQ